MSVLDALGHALAVSGSMTWQITWSLILGFTLSAIVQAVVRRSTIIRLLGDDRPATLARATGFGAASSSCSYAAVALARSLFRKGASFTAAMVFEIASTNLVIELGIILALLISWQFTLAEFIGGPIMIAALAVAFRLFVRRQLIDAAREQADKGLAGSMEGHAAMDMSIAAGGSVWRRLLNRDGYTSVSHIFVMEWAAVIRDVVIGLLIAGAVGAWVPATFWQHLFLAGHPLASRIWGPVIGPVIAVLSFVCSIGNVPLAAVLWNGGISFGGVVSFIFADLIILPILVIYRKYYGTRMMLTLLGIFYATMVRAGYIVGLLFSALGLVPAERTAKVAEVTIQWNYTTILNIIFLLVAAALLVRFFRSGGGAMLKMMGGSPDAHGPLAQGGHDPLAHGGADQHPDSDTGHHAPGAAGHHASSGPGARGETGDHARSGTDGAPGEPRVLPSPGCRPSADAVYARSAADVWAVGGGNCQDEHGPFYLLHFNGSRWRLVAGSARYGEPLQITADGSGGFWIPTGAGFPGTFACCTTRAAA